MESLQGATSSLSPAPLSDIVDEPMSEDELSPLLPDRVQYGPASDIGGDVLMAAVREEEEAIARGERVRAREEEEEEELLGLANGVANAMPRGYDADSAVTAIIRALQELRSRQFLVGFT